MSSEVIDQKVTPMTVYKYRNKTVPMSEMRSEEKLAALISLMKRAEQAKDQMNHSIEMINKHRKQVDIQDNRIVTFSTLIENLVHFLKRDDNITINENDTVGNLMKKREQILNSWETVDK